MKAIKKSGNYYLYKIHKHYELWKGSYEGKHSYCAGYVANPENFEYAVEIAEEEIRCLMQEFVI